MRRLFFAKALNTFMLRIVLYLAVSLFAANFSIAQNSGIAILSEERALLIDSAHEIRDYAYIIKDEKKTGTLADVKALFQSNNFHKLNDFDDSNPGEGTYWISFSLKNYGNETDEVILYLGEEHDARIYGADEEKRVGVYVPANQKKGALPKGFLLREDGYSGQVLISLEAGQTSQIFVKTNRILNKAFPFTFKLYHPRTWKETTAIGNRNYGQGLVQGVLWTLILYHLLLFIILRDPIYAYYCLYIFGIAIITLGYFGYLHEFFFSNRPLVAKFLTQAAQFGTLIMAFVFGSHFVRLDKLLPKWNRRIQLFIKTMSSYLLFVAISYLIFRDYRIINYSYYFAIPIVLLGLYFCITLMKTKDKVAQNYAWASSFFVVILLVNMFITFLTYHGIIQERPYQRFFIAQAGVLIHLLTFALGLGIRSREKDMQAQRMTELDKMKSRFFANVSHEFRTPLTLIMGPLKQLMSGESETEKVQQYKLMYQNSERLLRLINELLSLSELEMGKMQLQASYGDINAFVRSFTLSFESLANIKNIEIKLDTPEKGLNCWFDAEKLEKILGNLLSNAFKFTPEGGIITVSLEQSRDRKKVVIAVRDSGPGIEKALLPQVFDRFFYANNKTPDGQVGTGIGLSLTKELVLLHHGEIFVESQLGHGACFQFSLPLDEKHLKKEERIKDLAAKRPDYNFTESMQPQALSTAAETSIEGEETQQILLVEDNPEVRAFIKSYLSPHYQVTEAEDGQEALGIAIEKIPDLIISDVMMPNMDGNELCDKLKNDEKTNHIPIVLLTARSAKADKIQGLTLGADTYLTKPFDKDELLAHISNLLLNRQRLKSKFAEGKLLESEVPELPDRDRTFLHKVNTAIEAHLDEEAFGVEELLRVLAMSRTQLHRKLKAITNQSTTQYMRGIRLEHARKLLQTGEYNVTETAFKVGFNSQTYFSKSFKEYFGFPPSELE